MTVREFVNKFVGHNSTITIYSISYNPGDDSQKCYHYLYNKVWQGMDWQVSGSDDGYCKSHGFEICPYRDSAVVQVKQFPHGEFTDYIDLII